MCHQTFSSGIPVPLVELFIQCKNFVMIFLGCGSFPVSLAVGLKLDELHLFWNTCYLEEEITVPQKSHILDMTS
ncbi:hypothetical protein Y1Q_0000778 [Alligator mississippiensis]|uniref:Uncharacterized protein n=1 Tax=Alligator mississippiensis TaxID=8496 RepID=A0A151MCG5_ALLMI|nr:hypothetical protein Y1Q_0000778 [Alligator mississippiensis]